MARPVVRQVLFAAICVLLLLLVLAVWFQAGLTTERDHKAADVVVTVEPGMGTREIVARLANAGVIEDQTLVLVYLVLTRSGSSLKAGDYQFESPISAIEVIEKIRRGEVATRRVTIPEGLNRYEVAELLAERTRLASRDRFLVLTGYTDLIRDLDPQASSLEGYLFPDTYEYTTKTTPEELIETVVGNFRKLIDSKPEVAQLLAARQLTLHQAVTMASLVEEEARVDEERAIIASVFYNRLVRDMKLASDPTFVYAAVQAGDYDGDVNNPKHRQRLSPYNTYVFTGLPPGPITNPGWKSFEAALKPEQTSYLYFVVSGKEGRHKFSRTVEEHERAVAEYRAQQRSDGTE